MRLIFVIMALLAPLLANDFVLKDKDNEIIIFSLKQNPVNTAVIIPEKESDKALIEKAYSKGKTRANEHNVVLIKNPNFTALIDTGYANTLEILGQKLLQKGVKFEDITHIILTHAHGDHIGGLMGNNPFSKAQILIDKKEYDFWIQSERQNVKESLQSLKNLSYFEPQKELIAQNSGLRAVPFYGHTPGHNVIELAPNLVFAADIFHAYDIQIQNPKIAVTYDSDKDAAIKAREDFLQRYKGFSFVGTHTPFTKPVKIE